MRAMQRGLRCCDALVSATWEATMAPKERECKGLEDVAPTLKTGDVVLFRFSLEATMPGTFTVAATPWNHVGIVFVVDDEVYVLDSTGYRTYPFCFRPLDFGEAPTDEWRKGSGPQMFSLRQMHEAHAAAHKPCAVPARRGRPPVPWRVERIAVRRLVKPLDATQLALMREAVVKMRDRTYEEHRSEVIAAAIDVWDCCQRFTEDDFDLDSRSAQSLSCAEFAAHVFITAGVLPKTLPAYEFIPANFARDAGGNLSAPCGCCVCSWFLARAFGCGDVRALGGAPLFHPEQVLAWPRPSLAPRAHVTQVAPSPAPAPARA